MTRPEERPAALPPDAERPIRALWREVFAGDVVRHTREDLRGVARVVGRAARREGLLPEQLIVAVKESWHAHDGVRGLGQRHTARWVLTELISLCICAYYEQGPPARGELEPRPGFRDAPRATSPWAHEPSRPA